jgi:hypothetical protein
MNTPIATNDSAITARIEALQAERAALIETVGTSDDQDEITEALDWIDACDAELHAALNNVVQDVGPALRAPHDFFGVA